jgi:hypothetical protein
VIAAAAAATRTSSHACLLFNALPRRRRIEPLHRPCDFGRARAEVLLEDDMAVEWTPVIGHEAAGLAVKCRSRVPQFGAQVSESPRPKYRPGTAAGLPL